MPKLPESTIESVREQTNILDVVSQYVQLKKSGQNWFGLCPFQTEKTPSFSVSESKQIFHCFSCGRGGNVFKFLMEIKHISFPEAVIEVAKDRNINIPQQYLNAPTVSNNKDSKHHQLIQIYNQVAQLYHHILMNTEIGQPALDYLHQRGLNDKTINTFNLGYAPSEVLIPFLKQHQVDYQTMRHSGLVSERQDGQLGDRFFNRVMYPIRNFNGSTIAFSGRVLSSDDQAKYLNSPETPLFHKGRTIFNYDLAKPAIKEYGNVVLFEGFMDVISAFQAGVKNGIASMGTSLTDGQIDDIEHVTDQLYICYDGDQPGQKAINRALNLLEQRSNLNLGVVQLPAGLDPDEYCRQKGASAFQKLIQNGRETAISFKLSFLKEHLNLKQDEDRLQYINQALQMIAKLNSPVERDLYIKRIANQFDLSIDSLNSQLSMLVNRFDRHQRRRAPRFKIDLPTAQPEQHYNYVEQAERCLLWRMLHDRDIWIKVSGINDFHFHDEQYQMLYVFASEYFKTHENYQVADFMDFIHNDQYQKWAMALENVNIPKLSSDDEIADYVNIILYIAPLVDQIDHLDQQLKMADRIGDLDRQVQLGSQLIHLKQRLNHQKHAKVKI